MTVHTLQGDARVRTQRRRVLISGTIGTTIEYFDFLLFGLIAPVVFNQLFFPQADPLVGTIAVLATFAVGYVARPLGGLVFGHFGDRVGRKPIMFVTLVLMGAATTGIGLLPTYAAIGVAAPILLTLLRCVQGFALGGETVGATIMATESAPQGKRGGYAGTIQIGGALGSVLASLAAALVASMPTEDALAWGWRVPFLLSAVLVVVGVYVRTRIDESPVFRNAVREAPPKAPLLVALREEPKACLTVFLCVITETSMLQLFTVYALVYGGRELGIPTSVMLNGVLIGNIVGIAMNPLFGRLSDFIGRRILIASSLVIGALYTAFAFFPMLASGNTVLIVLALAIPPALIQTMIFATEASFFAELFRGAARRFSGLAVSRQVGGVIGGLFPLIAAGAYAAAGSVWAVVGYYAAISVVSLAAVLSARETHREVLG
ncbi:MHS family MFS transporter [Pseudonocardia sp. DSM 110487]|uniref:MFS transporter n=1 Tax=Pseudonocardia sp. DSM 110487 TaxID=2865833 RepID=UPI001C69FCD0|nr:MFS transporter [Pseudonocardia sp. DSM 110487]QYN32529.1 MHS family MFS transporter [Pseudonocardia sp. DSM 110487]